MSLEEQEYILGTDGGELERLRFQHQAWVKEGYALREWLPDPEPGPRDGGRDPAKKLTLFPCQ